MPGSGTVNVAITLSADPENPSTLIPQFHEESNSTQDGAIFDEALRVFETYQGTYTFVLTATGFTFAETAITFLGDHSGVTANLPEEENTVVTISNVNQNSGSVPQKVQFLIHHSQEPSVGPFDPTILNNPLPPPGS